MRFALTKLLGLLLVGEALVALLFAFLYVSYSYLSSNFTPLERSLLIASFVAAAACCAIASVVLFNNWHAGEVERSDLWRLSLLSAAGLNLAALAFDVRELAKGGWSSAETLGFFVEFAVLAGMASALASLALSGKKQSREKPPAL